MQSGAAYRLAALLTVLPCQSAAAKSPAGYVRLKLEDRTTLHVGQIAVLMMPSPARYTIDTAGKVLVPIERTKQDRPIFYLYRAVRPGDETMLVTRSEPGPDGCISCVTRHYFITVIP